MSSMKRGQDSASLGSRLVSLDAFRGLTMAAMILVNNPGNWGFIYPQLSHAEWHGWTATDLIFPFFLFIVGVSMVFSFARGLESRDRRALVRSVIRRTAVLFALGMLHGNFLHLSLDSLRYVGVLQRIALVYLVASLIVLFLPRSTQIWVVAGLLLGYWALMTLVPVPGYGAGVLTEQGNLAGWVDRHFLPGRKYGGFWDPDGLLSTLPAIATCMLGVFTGQWLRSGRGRFEIAGGMFTAGWLAILVGMLWGQWFPINRHLWTSSFAVFSAGAAMEALALCYWLIDVRGYRRWAQPAVVFGVNAIVVFVLSGMVGRLLDATGMKWSICHHFFDSWLSPHNASMAFAIAYVVFWWVVMTLLYRRQIFIKV